METLKSYDFSRSGARQQYDFDAIFDGRVHRLTRGKDFKANRKIKSLQGYFAQKARSRGLGLHTQIESDDALVVQSYERDKPAPRRTRRAKAKSTTNAKPEPALTAV